jgi:hypothetical protein
VHPRARHMGRLPQPEGMEHPAFEIVKRLIDSGRAWVKLSGPYLDSRAGPPAYSDIGAVARALVHYAPDRCVWGKRLAASDGTRRQARRCRDARSRHRLDGERGNAAEDSGGESGEAVWLLAEGRQCALLDGSRIVAPYRPRPG